MKWPQSLNSACCKIRCSYMDGLIIITIKSYLSMEHWMQQKFTFQCYSIVAHTTIIMMMMMMMQWWSSSAHIPPRTHSGRVWVQLEVEPEFSHAPLMHLLCTMDLWMSRRTLTWSSAWNPLNCMAFSAH